MLVPCSVSITIIGEYRALTHNLKDLKRYSTILTLVSFDPNFSSKPDSMDFFTKNYSMTLLKISISLWKRSTRTFEKNESGIFELKLVLSILVIISIHFIISRLDDRQLVIVAELKYRRKGNHSTAPKFIFNLINVIPQPAVILSTAPGSVKTCNVLRK